MVKRMQNTETDSLSGSVEFRTVCFIDVILVSRSVSLALTSIAS